MRVFKKIGVRSLARFNLYYMGIVGLIIGAIVGLPTLFFGITSGFWTGNFNRVFRGLALLVGMPVFYGFLGLVFGYVGGYVINYVLKLSGGIRFEVDSEK